MSDSLPYLRLSGFYFFYFALLGALVPYWSLYLNSFGFDAFTIGVLMAILHATRIFAPSLWGWMADKSGQRLKIVRFGALMTLLAFSIIFWQQGALGIGLVMLLFSFFWNAVLPQFEVITLSWLGEARSHYSRIRLWGSVGFIVTVAGVGYLLDWISVSKLPLILLLLMLLIWLNTLLVSEPAAEHVKAARGDFMALLMRPQVVAFFVICFLVQFGHGAYYTFFSVMMEGLGYGRGEIGLLWAVGVVAEVAIFIVMHRLIDRFGVRAIMIVSLLLCAVRWTLTGLFPESLPLMLLMQSFHAATFGCLHAVGIHLVHFYFTTSTHGQGQALFSSFGFGAGGAAGALVSGMMWDAAGPVATFLLAAAVSLVAIVLATVWIYPEKLQQSDG